MESQAFSENGIDVVKPTNKNMLRTIENGVRFGKWVLLENVLESLDASLEPLLLQQKFKQGGTEMIKIGDSSIPCVGAQVKDPHPRGASSTQKQRSR